MNRTQANEILHMLRTGNGDFSRQAINDALRATGDLCPMPRPKSERGLKGIDTLPPRVWRAALAGGNSEARL